MHTKQLSKKSGCEFEGERGKLYERFWRKIRKEKTLLFYYLEKKKQKKKQYHSFFELHTGATDV